MNEQYTSLLGTTQTQNLLELGDPLRVTHWYRFLCQWIQITAGVTDMSPLVITILHRRIMCCLLLNISTPV